METFYTVIENQRNADGTFGLLHYHYTDRDQAYSKYFTICATAAISDIPYYAAYLIDSGVGVIEQREWDRREVE